MRTLAVGSKGIEPPRSRTACRSLPPEGAQPCLGRPGAAADVPPRPRTACRSLPPQGAAFLLGAAGQKFQWPLRPRTGGLRTLGFTLLELLLVVSIMALATAGVSLALRDPSETQLEREAERLAALLDGARAQSRAAGVPVRWRVTDRGFQFEGLVGSGLPNTWLDANTRAYVRTPLLLGPEPLIPPQAVVLSQFNHPERRLQVATDGLRPFAVQGLP